MFQVSCVAQGKPHPTVRWMKDDNNLTGDGLMYNITTHTDDNRIITVNSTLTFIGQQRPHLDEIVASDRGKYTCVFTNEVKKAESQMFLKVEHPPIALPQYGKVAYDLRETATVACKVQAWPKPEFQWSFETNQASLQGSSSDGHYEIFTSSDNNDVYTSVLNITDIQEHDYGAYSCRAANALGFITSTIMLQPKGAPEKPTGISAAEIGPTHIALHWQFGFDGGLPITNHFVSYRRIAGSDEGYASDCVPVRNAGNQWQEIDCRRTNPCNISGLEAHQTYAFKVKVYNTKDSSDYSDEFSATTTVTKIPAPSRVTYDPASGTLAINIAQTCLALVASIERLDEDGKWQYISEWPLDVLGGAPTQREGALPYPDIETSEPGIKVRLCLKTDREKCGEYTKAESKFLAPRVLN